MKPPREKAIVEEGADAPEEEPASEDQQAEQQGDIDITK